MGLIGHSSELRIRCRYGSVALSYRQRRVIGRELRDDGHRLAPIRRQVYLSGVQMHPSISCGDSAGKD
jgi:hypothetical protein